MSSPTAISPLHEELQRADEVGLIQISLSLLVFRSSIGQDMQSYFPLTGQNTDSNSPAKITVLPCKSGSSSKRAAIDCIESMAKSRQMSGRMVGEEVNVK